jgi:hypothetical protein
MYACWRRDRGGIRFQGGNCTKSTVVESKDRPGVSRQQNCAVQYTLLSYSFALPGTCSKTTGRGRREGCLSFFPPLLPPLQPPSTLSSYGIPVTASVHAAHRCPPCRAERPLGSRESASRTPRITECTTRQHSSFVRCSFHWNPGFSLSPGDISYYCLPFCSQGQGTCSFIFPLTIIHAAQVVRFGYCSHRVLPLNAAVYLGARNLAILPSISSSPNKLSVGSVNRIVVPI